MFIYLSVYSNNEKTSKDFLKLINRLTKIKIFSIQRQKIQKFKIFTVLKSPHVNKKAQEHFKLFRQKNQIELNLFQIQKFFVLLKKIQTKFFPNISIKVSLYLHKSRTKKNQINPNIFKFEYSKSLLVSDFMNYIKIFDAFGELSLKNMCSKLNSLDSSVGRAKDWKSLGRQFNPVSKQLSIHEKLTMEHVS
uniref:ribosomal protein S10 n=1 Tax=Odontella aurita TaxID=265563 RepID=UPI002028BEC2|nr:ribosomal protein S10 [Odontella aurita]QYB22944.1 ribosomal protein S10 [Odontella aurita]